MKRKIIAFLACAGIVLLAAAVAVWLTIPLNRPPSVEQYPIRGVDVSAYQGEIDWGTLAAQEIQFAYIKATEGSTFVDERFAYNYAHAAETDLRIGAYHFFSFDSLGATQAENFIRTVEPCKNMLPPAVDVEFYGDYDKTHPPADLAAVRQELSTLLNELEEAYQMKPILYATMSAYDLLLVDEFIAYDIWIRNILRTPRLSDRESWTFWQYSDHGKLAGYDGEEPHIDLNVFYGSAEDFAKYR